MIILKPFRLDGIQFHEDFHAILPIFLLLHQAGIVQTAEYRPGIEWKKKPASAASAAEKLIHAELERI